MKDIKRILLVAAGVCWLLFAGGIGLALIQYFAGGGGMQVFGFLGLSSLTVVLGLGQVIGFVVAAFVCFAIGMLLCLHGLIPSRTSEQVAPSVPDSISSSSSN
ncbi:MAG TPA: hypothetical protein VK815_02675 [Candidatus Acidoferrales bacterium]|jgi:hypothetical protein|nr:hypothetical protein [Candidatus Acidoferrales bacterium]